MNFEKFRHLAEEIEAWLQAHMAMSMPWGTPNENKIANSDIQVSSANGMDGVDETAASKAKQMQKIANERRAQ